MDAHAYVDECLCREDQIAFEGQKLRDDPGIAKAGRFVAGAKRRDTRRFSRSASRSRAAFCSGRPFHENVSPPAIDSRRAGAAATSSDAPAPPQRTSLANVRQIAPRPTLARRRSWGRTLRSALILSLVVGFAGAQPRLGGPPDERGPLIGAGLAAFR